jgi:hypothetical protein
MDSYRGGDLTITVIEVTEPARFYVSLSGRGNEREPRNTLQPYLRELVDRAVSSRAAIELQCQRLAYINSATIGCVVDMIHRCEAATVPVTLRYDRGSGWQRLSFEALRVLVKGAGQLAVEAV